MRNAKGPSTGGPFYGKSKKRARSSSLGGSFRPFYSKAFMQVTEQLHVTVRASNPAGVEELRAAFDRAAELTRKILGREPERFVVVNVVVTIEEQPVPP